MINVVAIHDGKPSRCLKTIWSRFTAEGNFINFRVCLGNGIKYSISLNDDSSIVVVSGNGLLQHLGRLQIRDKCALWISRDTGLKDEFKFDENGTLNGDVRVVSRGIPMEVELLVEENVSSFYFEEMVQLMAFLYTTGTLK